MRSDRRRLERLCTACLRDGFDVQMRVSGQSMKPTIRDGALIRIKPIDPDQVRTGDVILYCKADGVIAHRVVALSHQDRQLIELTTRGDASSTCDAPVQTHQVLGKVVTVDDRELDQIITEPKRRQCLPRWFLLLTRLCGFKGRNFLK